MKIKKLLGIISVAMFFFGTVPQALAAAPDGSGPWADGVFAASQGLMKNGISVPAPRSDATAALGIAEGDTLDGTFYSLGFGGTISLSFDNGISNGAMIVESTNPGYPGEVAKVEMSADGVTWVLAGTVTQDGTVNQPQAIVCVKYVRITDISDASIFSDATADGYDVDGVNAIGDLCTPSTSPIPTPSQSPAPTANPTASPTDSSSTSSTTSTTSVTVPGFPNTGSSCTQTTISFIPNIIDARRVSPTSIFVRWSDGGLNNFIVQYGYQNGNWQFSTQVSGNSTTIGSLPTNQSIWIRVAVTDNCTVGTFGTPVLVGGTVSTNSPGFPNTGTLIPRLPNTGMEPDNKTFMEKISNGVSVVISFLLKTLHLENLHSK